MQIFKRKRLRGGVITESANYYGRLCWQGRDLARDLGTGDSTEAWRRLRSIKRNLEAGRFEVLEQTKKRREMATFAEVFAIYLQRAKVEPRTARGNIGAMRKLLRTARPELRDKPDLDLDALPSGLLTAELMADFQTAMLAAAGNDKIARNTAAISANSWRRQARSIFSQDLLIFYRDHTLPDLDGFMRIKPLPERSSRFTMPDPSVLTAIRERAGELRSSDPNAYRAFLLSFGCGLRRGEVAHARWTWIETASVPTPTGPQNRRFLRCQISADFDLKDREDRLVPIEDFVFDELTALRLPQVGAEASDYLLTGNLTERYRHTFDRFSAWLQSMGWDRKKKAHEFRKIYNTLVRMQAGADTARSVLGHSSDHVNREHYTDERLSLPAIKIFNVA